MIYSIQQDKNEFLTKEQIREIAPSVFTIKADKKTPQNIMFTSPPKR
jgi:hypothetical protein